MDDRNPLLAMLAMGLAPLRRLQPRMLALRRIALGVALGLYLVSVVITCVMLWIAWRHDDYMPVLTGVVANVQLLAFLIILVKMGIRPHLFAAAAVTLQEAARQGVAELAPEAETQPTSATPDSVGERSFGPFRWPGAERAVWIASAGATYLVIAPLAIALAPYMLTQSDKEVATGLPTPYFLAVSLLGIVLCSFALALLAYARQLHAGRITVVADAAGLRGWRFGLRRRETSLRWQDARTFSRIQAPSKGMPSREVVHILAGEEMAVAWTVPTDSAPAVLDANTRLLELIAARTSLPLRDLSTAVEKVAASPVGTVALWATRPGAPIQRRHVRIMRLIAWGMALMLVPLLLYGVMAAMQWYEPIYYNGLVPHVHAQSPLYADALATPTGVWPVQNSGGIASEYVDSAYRLTVTNGMFYAPLTEATYGASAVEVTMQQTGGVDYGGAGLVVRADPTKHMQMIFRLSGGVWTLALMPDTPDGGYIENWTVLASGVDHAAHEEIGAENQLLVVMRGGEYICYIDGHFVGIAHDGTLNSGHVGLFVDFMAEQVTFSDFTVYSA